MPTSTAASGSGSRWRFSPLRLWYWATAALLLSQPISVSATSVLHVVWCLVVVWLVVRYRRWHLGPRAATLWACWLAYYGVLLLGPLVSEDDGFAWVLLRKSLFLLTVGAGFALVPRLPKTAALRLVLAFVSGCAAMFAIAVPRALWRYLQTGSPEVWFYHELPTRHSVFVSADAGAAVLLLVWLLVSWRSTLVKAKLLGLAWGLLLALLVFLTLLSSRTVVVSVALAALAGVAVLGNWRTVGWRNRLGLATLVLAVPVALVTLPFQRERVAEATGRLQTLQQVPTEGTLDPALYSEGLGLRLVFWNNALTLWQASPWLGVGTGDAQGLLGAKARAQGLPDPYPNFDTHNQYIQSLLQSGIVGLGALVALLLVPAGVQLRKRNYAFVVFTAYFMALNLTATYLNSEVTLTFYTLVAGLLYWQGRPNG